MEKKPGDDVAEMANEENTILESAPVQEQPNIKQFALESHPVEIEHFHQEQKPEQVIQQKVLSFIESSFVGNFDEAEKAFQQIDLPKDSNVHQIVQFVKTITKHKNQRNLSKIQQTKQAIEENFDLNSLEKIEEIEQLDQLLNNFKNQFKKLESLKKIQIKEEKPEINAFLNVVWLIKSFINFYSHILSKGEVELKLEKHRTQVALLPPDVQIYEMMSQFHDFIKICGSFVNLRKIFDGEVAQQYLDEQFAEGKKSIDSALGFSALKFKNDLIHIFKNIKHVYSSWQQLSEKFFSNQECINLEPEKKQQFQRKVKEINELTRAKLSHRIDLEELKEQMSLNGFFKCTNSIEIAKDHNQTIDKFETQIEKLTNQTSDLRQQLELKNRTIMDLKIQFKQLKRNMSNTQTQKLQKQEYLQSKVSELQLQLMQLHDQNIKLKQHQRINSYTGKQKLQKPEYLQREVSELQLKLMHLHDEIKCMKDFNCQLDQKLKDTQKALKLKQNHRCYLQYFNGNILNVNSQNHLEWFVQSLQKCTQKRIRATYPLYRFGERCWHGNFHHYIDNKPNIVLVVKITNGQIIAGYSNPPFNPKINTENKQGLIFGIKNQKIFTLRSGQNSKYLQHKAPKPITYDGFFIVWGNSDIRIKYGTYELFSSYGMNSSFYEEIGNQNPKIFDLLLSDDRQAWLVDYEFFRVEFEGEKYEEFFE